VSTPRVSLGLPVYDGARFLAEALDSALAQTFGDFELLISDNASTDDTAEIARAYEARDRRIRYTRHPSNLGQSPNFRSVFERTSAPYFKWMVHDDVLEPGYLRACVARLDEAAGSAVLAYPRTLLIDESGRVLEPFEDRMDLRDRAPSRRLGRLLRDFRLGHCALGLIRREALAQTDLIGPYEHSDIVLLAQLALRGEFREHPEILYRRRIHPRSSFADYRSPQEFARRMDSARRPPRVSMPRTRLFWNLTRSIAGAPLSPLERLRCERELLAAWGPRYWRVVGGEWKALLLHPLRRRPRRS
jgi:glycosyltransferase involved in cell wall biosynthesis